MTKQWTAKWPHIANVVARIELYKITVNKVTSEGFRGAIAPCHTLIGFGNVYWRPLCKFVDAVFMEYILLFGRNYMSLLQPEVVQDVPSWVLSCCCLVVFYCFMESSAGFVTWQTTYISISKFLQRYWDNETFVSTLFSRCGRSKPEPSIACCGNVDFGKNATVDEILRKFSNSVYLAWLHRIPLLNKDGQAKCLFAVVPCDVEPRRARVRKIN